MDEKEKIERPKDWPANTYEQRLSLLRDLFDEFLDKPSYLTRERLVAAATSVDLNDNKFKGIYRITDYEVYLINTLYILATRSNVCSVINYLYSYILNKTRLYNMSLYTVPEIAEDREFKEQINLYKTKLYPSLKLFHLAYTSFNIGKDMSFFEYIKLFVDEFLCKYKDRQSICTITFSFSQMLMDFSRVLGGEKLKLIEFSKHELFKLFKLEAKLFRLNKQVVSKSPTRGMLMMQISNLILKGRNKCNSEYICKYMSTDASKKTIENHELWMHHISKLNDKKEQRSIIEILKNKTSNNCLWSNNISLKFDPEYYLSSYCKNPNDENMKKKYGSQIYGYKTDRIVDLIGPINFLVNKKDNSKIPTLSNSVVFDVIYDKKEINDELDYLIKVIDLFELTFEEKREFYIEILQYWLLSYKDKEWKYENERRYVIRVNKNLTMIETEIDSDFLKLKTCLYYLPDFIIGDTLSKIIVRNELECKRDKLFSGDYYYCRDCFMQDHDMADKNAKKCPICGSHNIHKISK